MRWYQELKKLQKGPEKDGYIVFYFYRRISIFFSMFFISLGITANMITFLSLVADVIAVYFLYSKMWIAAAVFVQIAIILDNSDGEVARFYKTKEKNPKEKHYGAYLDEIIGTIGFGGVIFAAGYYLHSWQLGIFSMSALFLLIISSLTAKVEFANKTELARNVEKKFFGRLKGRVGFTNAVQRILISMAILLTFWELIFLFGILAYLLVLLKFYVYRNQ